MSKAQLGRIHTEETKGKIGDAHRGKKLSEEQIEGMRQRMTGQPAPFAGHKHTAQTRAMMSRYAFDRELAYPPGKRAAINKAIGEAISGAKRTDEQKETYRAARSKWMSDNPRKVGNTTGERTITAWLEANLIQYKRQFQISGLHHPFDFYLPEYNTLIEFDGSHHWFRPWWNVAGRTEEEIAAILEKQRAKDMAQTVFAEAAGYIVIRIRGKADVGDCKEWGTLEEQFTAAMI